MLFWVVMPCGHVYTRILGESYCLHLQGFRASGPKRWYLPASNTTSQPEKSATTFTRQEKLASLSGIFLMRRLYVAVTRCAVSLPPIECTYLRYFLFAIFIILWVKCPFLPNTADRCTCIILQRYKILSVCDDKYSYRQKLLQTCVVDFNAI